MKRLFFLSISFCLSNLIWGQKADVEIVFNTPAEHFTQALPLGNGRLGAMPFGQTDNQQILLNEISMWSGGPFEPDSPNAHTYLPKIQQLLKEGKNLEAQRLLEKHFVTTPENGSCWGRGKDCHYGTYQMLAWLNLKWNNSKANISNYQRKLNIEDALATTTYTRDLVPVTERVFTDFKNDLIWIEITSKEPKIDLTLNLSRPENAQFSTQNNQLIMQGQLTNAKEKGLKFITIAQIITQGNIKTSPESIQISNTDKVWIKISAHTNYNYKSGGFTNENLFEKAQNQLKEVENLSFEQALSQSKIMYGQYFERNRWKMPEQGETKNLTTLERLINYYQGKVDNQLPILYYNFGRYLLISSSRKGLLPANLQGLWADSVQSPWNGDYHLNINVQMNYWLAEQTNLSELAEPLHRFTKNLMSNGRKTAKAYYNAPGWVAHVISNPWFFTSPGEGSDWGSTLTGGAWLCQHIWEHYAYTNDIDFLRTYYPVLKEAAVFLKNILIKDPKTGYWVTSPSNSPEHAYKFPIADGKFIHLNTCMGPTMDMQIVRELFSNVIKASEILKIDKLQAKQWKEIIAQTAPNTIGKKGDLNEWLEDWEDAEPEHRHISHLYGLHPYDEITPWDTPELAQAARNTLKVRGDKGTGWSRAWKINFWARLGDGNHALKLFHELLKPVSNMPKENTMRGGGTYENLFCAHPPFQIDGNFGGTAGLAEMLLQSQGKNNVIRMLPALPSSSDWKQGEIKGMKARNGFEVNIRWNDAKVSQAEIISHSGKLCYVLLPPGKSVYNPKGKNIANNNTSKSIVVHFSTEKKVIYTIK